MNNPPLKSSYNPFSDSRVKDVNIITELTLALSVFCCCFNVTIKDILTLFELNRFFPPQTL